MPKSKHRKKYYEKKRHQNRAVGNDHFATMKPHEREQFIESKQKQQEQLKSKTTYKNEQRESNEPREQKSNSFFGRVKRNIRRLF